MSTFYPILFNNEVCDVFNALDFHVDMASSIAANNIQTALLNVSGPTLTAGITDNATVTLNNVVMSSAVMHGRSVAN